MKTIKIVSAVSLLIPAIAAAQPEPPVEVEDNTGFDHAVAPVSQAFEIGVSTGYAQGVGKLGGNMGSLEDVSGAGGLVGLDLNYRITPHMSVGAYGTFSRYQRGDDLATDTDVFGVSAGLQGAWHFRPARSVDPWVSLGGGWKGLWLDPTGGEASSLQGLDLARLQLGIDYRVSDDVAIAPVIGGSLSTFISQDSPMTNDLTEIDNKEVAFTGFAGIAGRFDLGGRRGY